ncbi:MAG TPA: hypothetical protein O0X70_01980, partial [Methanocorpusculum sp.]|nr:hypothetical protein [Methanocorpusculum sp.]
MIFGVNYHIINMKIMTAKRIFIGLLTLFLVFTIFCGSGCAMTGFSESKTTYTISPDEVLQVGDTVKATIMLYFPHDYPRSTETIKLETPLSDAGWEITPIAGSHELTYTTRQGKSAEIPSFFINFDYEFQIQVELTGTVPSTLAGQTINVVTIQHCSGNSVISSFISPDQLVDGENTNPEAIKTQTPTPTPTPASTGFTESKTTFTVS